MQKKGRREWKIKVGGKDEENKEDDEKKGKRKMEKNLISKEVREKKDTRESIKTIGKDIGVEIKREEVKKVKTGKEKKEQIEIVKERLEENKKLLGHLKKLKRQEIQIEIDQTFREKIM